MEEAGQRGRTQKSRACPSCGALNGSDFDRCVRCGGALSSGAALLDRLRAQIDGRSLLATKALIALTLVVFALQVRAELAHGTPFDKLVFGGNPAITIRFGALALLPMLPGIAEEPWRLLSAVFVHYGLLHVGMNMLTLSYFGRVAEPAIGSARFAIAYVSTGIAGFALSVAFTMLQGETTSTAGASGAVCGIMGLVLGFGWRWRRNDPQWRAFAIRTVAWVVLFGFIVNASRSGIAVNNAAHLGGLGVGMLLGALFAGPRVGSAPRGRSDLLPNLGAALSVAACVASLVFAQLSPAWKLVERLLQMAS